MQLLGVEIMSGAVSMPPRAGKSYLTSLYCAWWLGRNPTKCVMRNTVTTELYHKFSYDVRAILQLDKYKAVFPHVKLAPDKQNVNGWALTTSTQGAYFGGGVGKNIIGFGANLAITDDLYAGFAEALSPTVNEATHTWKQGSHDSRMETGCPELYIGTRWSVNDVIGKAQIEGHIDRSVTISALTEEGLSFCENVKTTAEYQKTKKKNDPMIWSAEYMQQPVEAEGLLFPRDQIKLYAPEMALPGEHHFMPIDPANHGGDYFASMHCVLYGNSIYVPHVFCNKEGSDENNILHEQYIRKAGIEVIHYEGVMQWQEKAKALRNKLSDLDSLEFRITNPTTNKHTRILVNAPFVKTNFYFREDYDEIPEYRTFMNNLCTYMRNQTGNSKAKQDDAPDAAAAAAAYFDRNFDHLWT